MPPARALLVLAALAGLLLPRAHALLCATSACAACQASCPPFSEQAAEYADCSKMLTVASSKYISEALLDCALPPCIPHNLAHGCHLLADASPPRPRAALLAALDAARADAHAAALASGSAAATLSRSVSPARRGYYARVLDTLVGIQVKFSGALRTRAHRHRQRDYLSSLRYRAVRQEVRRLRFENDDLRQRLAFWKATSKTVALAAQTSPRTLRDTRDALRRQRDAYAADAALVDGLRTAADARDVQAGLIVQLKARVRDEIDALRSVNAHARREAEFIADARREMFNLFMVVVRGVRAKQLRVPCGDLAVSTTITDAILASG